MTGVTHRIVLTGASGGLGHAFALALAPQASAMVLCGRNHARLEALRNKIEAMHPRASISCVQGDLLDAEVQARVFAAASGLSDPIDLLINAAGTSDFRSFEQTDAATMQRLIGINLLAPIAVTQRLLPLLRSAPRAQIVNIGSIFGYIGYPGFALYCATKFGLRGFSQALRRELSDTRISVRYFAPRAVRTDLNTPAVTGMNEELGNAQDAPDAVAQALVRFLDARTWDRRLGLPERLYVWLNRLVPSVNDKAIRGQLAVIRKHLGQTADLPPHPERKSQ